MCSTFICCPWRGPWHFHPHGVCITWLPYFPVAGIENQLWKPFLQVGKGKMGNHSPVKHCSRVLSWNYERGPAQTPPQNLREREIRAATLHNGPGRSMENHCQHNIYNTYIKWHHGWVVIYSLLTLLKVICFCFEVACLVFAVNATEDSATCSHRRVDLLPVHKNARP